MTTFNHIEAIRDVVVGWPRYAVATNWIGNGAGIVSTLPMFNKITMSGISRMTCLTNVSIKG